MITIIHYFSNYHPYNGNIFNNFEYYIFLLKHNKNVILEIIYNDIINDLEFFQIMEDRYLLDDDYKNNISFVKLSELSKNYDKIITTSKTIYDISGNINANEIHMVHTWASYDKQFKNSIYKYIKNKNVISYNECKLVGDVNYIRPIYFDLLKKPKKTSNNIFLHLSGVREINLNIFLKQIYKLRENKDQKFIISLPTSQLNKMDFFNDLNCVTIYENHIYNLFESFNTYVYIMTKGFDYSPRMIVESKYFDKKIIFIRNHSNEDGGFNRYNSCINNDIEKYNITKNDKLLRNFL